jgi:hypothetical protein
MKMKWLAIGIILLFVGVTIAPTINFNTVKASTEDDLVEVTTQACGIQGYGDNTVKLTRQQYNDLEQYLVEFRARLNQTSTREEAIPIFNEAVVELDKYGLLPKGMSVEKAQQFITGWNHNAYEKLLNIRQQDIFPRILNAFCLIFGSATEEPDPHPGVLPFIVSICPFWIILSIPLILLLTLLGLPEINAVILLLMAEIYNPLRLMNIIIVSTPYTNLYSLGLKGAAKLECGFGMIILGYTGLLVTEPSGEKAHFLGFAPVVLAGY